MIVFSSVLFSFLKGGKQYPGLPCTQTPNFQMGLKQKGETPAQNFLCSPPLTAL